MIYGNVLPVTGAAGTFLLGHYLGLDDVIAAAVVTVLAGIAAYRYGTRLGRGRTTTAIALTAFAAGMATLGHLGGLSWSYAIAGGLSAAISVLYLLAAAAARARARLERRSAGTARAGR